MFDAEEPVGQKGIIDFLRQLFPLYTVNEYVYLCVCVHAPLHVCVCVYFKITCMNALAQVYDCTKYY